MLGRHKGIDITISIATILVGVLMIVLATLEVLEPLIASLIFGVCILLPLMVSFERGKYRCKVLVYIATLSAFAIVGRWALAWVPNGTLSTGIVILAGVCLGPIPGFAVGALTMLVSNMLLGQGIWTIWQMLVTGLVGLIAGYLRKADKIWLCVYGVFVGFFYGFVMNLQTFFAAGNITLNAFLVIWGMSFYFDLVHAISTVLTVLIFYHIIVPPIRRNLSVDTK